MNNENNDPQWKKIADDLRKLNVDFYWKMVHERPASRPMPPPRPCISKDISMATKQEHTPPIITGDEQPVSPQSSIHRKMKRHFK